MLWHCALSAPRKKKMSWNLIRNARHVVQIKVMALFLIMSSREHTRSSPSRASWPPPMPEPLDISRAPECMQCDSLNASAIFFSSICTSIPAGNLIQISRELAGCRATEVPPADSCFLFALLIKNELASKKKKKDKTPGNREWWKSYHSRDCRQSLFFCVLPPRKRHGGKTLSLRETSLPLPLLINIS